MHRWGTFPVGAHSQPDQSCLNGECSLEPHVSHRSLWAVQSLYCTLYPAPYSLHLHPTPYTVHLQPGIGPPPFIAGWVLRGAHSCLPHSGCIPEPHSSSACEASATSASASASACVCMSVCASAGAAASHELR